MTILLLIYDVFWPWIAWFLGYSSPQVVRMNLVKVQNSPPQRAERLSAASARLLAEVEVERKRMARIHRQARSRRGWL